MSSNAIGLAGGTEASPRLRAGAEAGLSIVVPVYNEAAGLAALHGRIVEVARRLREARGLMVEIVYVDDGSRDATLAVARALPAAAVDLQVVSLSRNFGKEAALAAGLDHARFGAVLFMDGDGQHPPDPDRDAGRAIGSIRATTSSTPPKRTAKTSRGSSALQSKHSTC